MYNIYDVHQIAKTIMKVFIKHEHAGTAELEVYPEGENNDNYYCEVWIPIKSK